jgi:hypothetical protein
MRAELVLSCFYNPISGSRNNPIILRKYRCFGIASTKKTEKIQKFLPIFIAFGCFCKRFEGFIVWGT